MSLASTRSSRSALSCSCWRWSNAEKWAAGVPAPGYAIDDQTAIKVTDGAVEVVSEGHWKLFIPSPEASESGA